MARLFQVNRSWYRKCRKARFRAACRPAVRRRELSLLVLLALLMGLSALQDAGGATASSQKKKVRPAKLKVSGYGFLGNRELKRILTTLELGGARPEFFRAAFIEDAALILSSRVKKDGFLHPNIVIELLLEDGEPMRLSADELLLNPLPRPLRAREARFHIHKGKLYHYEEITFAGLETISEKAARAFFIETGALVKLKRSRIYTPDKLKHGLNSLTDTLERQGFEEAKAQASDLKVNDKTGAARVRITVHQGVRSIVRSVKTDFFRDNATNAVKTETTHPRKPYSKLWVQDFELAQKTNQFAKGYPDAVVETKITSREPGAEGRMELEVAAEVHSGAPVRVGEVQFKGQKKSRRSLLSRRVRVQRGDLFNPIKIEEGRYRLAQLGSFTTVDVNSEAGTNAERNIFYTLKEGKSVDVNLLFGYGSYELLRGGIDTEAYNIWGLAHHARLKAVQSFKASTADFTYTIPEFVGRDIDLFFNASGLRREEISFTRLEYGGGFGGHRYFKTASTDVTVRYNYQILNAAEVPGVVISEGITNTSVGSIIFDLKHDRRDNPLYPRTGYKIFANLELASEYLAGDVNYQRVELSGSYHLRLGGGRYLGFGVSHGFVMTVGSTAEDLPFNRRFFPGGENSLRGYREGEASPRDARGKLMGAETYALGTVEFEQSITPKWSVVLFSDNLGMAEHIADYPFDTGLFSVGAGLRWKTLIGPIRVEYGYNLNPRPHDPMGTVHFSLGFPF